MTVQIDDAQIFNAISNAGYPAEATLLGSELVDAWISECLEHDKIYKTLLLEAGFFIELDERTFVVGACDRIMQDSDGVLVEESKSTASKKSKTFGPVEWFESISKSHQIPTYAAALKFGTFIYHNETLTDSGTFRHEDSYGRILRTPEWSPQVVEPRVLVRAVTKFKPCEIWPSAEGALIQVSAGRIEQTLNAYRNVAAGIRAMRKTGVVPWALPTHACVKVYGFSKFPCEFLRSCNAGEYRVGDGTLDGFSPGSSEVVKFLVDIGKVSRDNAEVVILSSSSIEDWFWCAERHRRRSLGESREEKTSLDVGSVLHVGLAAYRRILQEQGY